MIVTNSEGLTQAEVGLILGEPDRELARLREEIARLRGGLIIAESVLMTIVQDKAADRNEIVDSVLPAIRSALYPAGPQTNDGGKDAST